MPITGSYEYSEKNDRVKISIPLKGASPAKVDIFVTTSTLKVNYAPYLLDIILKGKIDAVRHKASVKDGILNITLFKIENALWGNLEAIVEDDEAIRIRKESVLIQENLEKDLNEKRRDKRIDDERISTRKQMALDDGERTRLENLKLEEKTAAEHEVYETLSKLDQKTKKTAPMKESIASPKNLSNSSSNSIIQQQLSNHKTNVNSDNNNSNVSNNKNYSCNNSPNAAGIPKNNDKAIFQDEDIIEVNPQEDENDSDEVEDEVDDRSLLSSSTQQQNGRHIPMAEETDSLLSALEDEEVRYIPPPRYQSQSQSQSTATASLSSQGKVNISFTPRMFPTPMRESKQREENDWVAKNRRHLKMHGVVGKSAPKVSGGDITEEDPAWLKAKGDDFYRRGDLLSAINAYSTALDIDQTQSNTSASVALATTLSCLGNRSACYLRLGQPADCEADCEAAIKLLDTESASGSDTGRETEPETESGTVLGSSLSLSLGMLVKLLLRMAVASCQLGKFSDSVQAYRRAWNTVSDNESTTTSLAQYKTSTIMADLEKVEQLANADRLKKEGDALFANSKLVEALAKYSEALQHVGAHAGCLSNRAACKIALGDLQGCVDDCTSALELLDATSSNSIQQPTGGGGGGGDPMSTINMLTSILPPPNSDKRKAWLLKTLVRRGAVRLQLENHEAALADYRAACILDPNNESLVSDTEKISDFLRMNHTS